jgi:hypothetical protein
LAHAYTPGLKVVARTTVRQVRLLPLPGEVLVQAGAVVTGEQVIARALLPGAVQAVNVVNQLGIEPAELPAHLLKKEGDAVQKDEPLARKQSFFKLFTTTVASPLTGTIESVSPVTGQVLLRHPPRPIELRAFLDGTVVEVLPRQGAALETTAALIQGIFGVGGETWGTLRTAVAGPEAHLTPDRLRPDDAGKVVVGGAFVDLPALERARSLGVRAVIAGGIHDADLRQLLGYDLGVAVTGSERLGLTLILTEGFGAIPMAGRTFALLASLEGRRASVSGATQIRAGVKRPEIIVPDPAAPADAAPAAPRGLQRGDAVRVIRDPYFGQIGQVEELPEALTAVESETKVRIVRLRLADGRLVVVPRSNVEAIEG